MITIQNLYKYPLKSGAALACKSVTGGGCGFHGDREFCLYRQRDNKFISLRDNVLIADLHVIAEGNNLKISFNGNTKFFDISSMVNSNIRIWSRDVDVNVMPADISRYVSLLIQEDVILARLLHYEDYSQSFMDTGPIHIISESAVNELSTISGFYDIDHQIFRPNIVVPDFAGLQESYVAKIMINGFLFNVTERTERCNAVSVLQNKRHSVENSDLLASIDAANQYDGAFFGLYLKAQGKFRVNIGDEVVIN